MNADTNSIIQTWIFGGQLVAYIATAVLLLRSLYAQNFANKLTSQKFIYDIRPFFTLVHQDYNGTMNGEDNFFENYLIQLENNTAKDFRIEVESRNFYSEKYHNRKLSIIPKGDKFEIIYGGIGMEFIEDEVNIFLYYSDEIGTKYSQLLHGKIHNLKLDPPVPV